MTTVIFFMFLVSFNNHYVLASIIIGTSDDNTLHGKSGDDKIDSF